jgi:hypothetical protein
MKEREGIAVKEWTKFLGFHTVLFVHITKLKYINPERRGQKQAVCVVLK